MVLLLSIIPEIKPQLLDVLFTWNPKLLRGYPEFGGVNGKLHGGFLPTVETALFILAGTSLECRLAHQHFFEPGHLFVDKKIMLIDHEDDTEPFSSSRIRIAPEFLAQLVYEKPFVPRFGPDFPARELHSGLTWQDLILASSTMDQLSELFAWLKHGPLLMDKW